MPAQKYFTEEARKEAHRQAVRKWRRLHPEKARDNHRRWCTKNRKHRLEYSRAWRSANPERVEAWSSARLRRIADMRAVVDRAKSRPCADCGGRFPPVAMDLDHRDPSAKTADVSKLAANRGRHALAELELEIEKCDVVCANCHRIRTARQNGWSEDRLMARPTNALTALNPGAHSEALFAERK